MLLSLRIRNYALIHELEVGFGPGLNVLTGETGAGKSILLGALGLVLGDRASLDMLGDKDAKCVVECSFDISAYELEAFFTDNDIDHENPCILRREITPAGKSRAFINDTPVTLDQIRELGLSLVEIHSQHNTLSLNRPQVQLSILDSWSGLQERVDAYTRLFRRWKSVEESYTALQEAHERSVAEQEHLLRQLSELRAADVKEGEKEAVEAELRVLEHGEEILRTLGEVEAWLEGEQYGALSLVTRSAHAIERLAGKVEEFNETASRLESARIELADLAAQLKRESDRLDFSPERLRQLRERHDLIMHLEHKHGVLSDEGLPAVAKRIEQKVGDFSSTGERLIRLEQEKQDLAGQVDREAGAISSQRHEGARSLEAAVVQSLAMTGLADAVFAIDLQGRDAPGPAGLDRLRFLFSAHPGTEASELQKIASGGELSRIMLAIKANVTRHSLLPTIIFDEIDSGISGKTAAMVGEEMSRLAARMQVITITHQPSIAGFGDAHYLVFKEKDATFIQSKIKKLGDNERVEVLASMISGGEATEASTKAATELLQRRERN